MSDHKRDLCRRGLHRMEGANIMINADTLFRFCRACRYAYQNSYMKTWRKRNVGIRRVR